MRTRRTKKELGIDAGRMILCFITPFLLCRFVFFIGIVPTVSMEPTVKAGTFCLGWRLQKNYRDGDIVAFYHDGTVYLKRIAASAGETVTIDGKETVVPEGKYFVRGDNAAESYDSRYWDEPFVDGEDLIAKILVTQKGVSKQSG